VPKISLPKIQLEVDTKNAGEFLKLDRKVYTPNHIPHVFRIAAAVTNGTIAIKGSKVGLKHAGGNNYLLTFE
jgi:hypothetical protein